MPGLLDRGPAAALLGGWEWGLASGAAIRTGYCMPRSSAANGESSVVEMRHTDYIAAFDDDLPTTFPIFQRKNSVLVPNLQRPQYKGHSGLVTAIPAVFDR